MPPLAPYDRQLPYSYALGLYPAMQALQHSPGSVVRVLIHSSLGTGEGAQALLSACKRLRIRTEQADRLLKRLSGKENCYAAAVFRKEPKTLLAEKNHLVLVNPMDAGNLGTILRTALGFGYEDIALIPPCADPYDPQVVRASMGAVFSLRVFEYPSLFAYLAHAGERVFFPFMLSDSAITLSQAILSNTSPHSLIFGNEGSGLPDSFANLGQPVRIEQSQQIDSLNLAVAAAIGMYSFHKI